MCGVLEPPLADAQPGQTGERPGVEAGTRTCGDPHAGGQLPVGILPPTLGHQHAPVIEAALGIEERTAVAGHELVGDPTPLRSPLQITRQLTSIEHVAARVDDRVQIPPLPGKRGRHRLVDQGEALRHAALTHSDQPQLRHRAELEIGVTPDTTELDRPNGQGLGDIEISHPVGARDVHPAVQQPRLEWRQQPLGTPNPAVGGSEVGEVRLVRDTQPDRALDRTLDVRCLPEQHVGPTGVADTGMAVAQPPQRRRQPETRLSTLAGGKGGLEDTAGIHPPPRLQSREPSGKRQILHRTILTPERNGPDETRGARRDPRGRQWP